MSDRRKRKATEEAPPPPPLGFFWQMSKPLRSSLMSTTRNLLPGARKQFSKEKEQHDSEKLARREEAVQRQLNNTIEAYAAALELFDQWQKQRVSSRAGLEKLVHGVRNDCVVSTIIL